ncbi:MAG TPA: hypothetical protein ENN29_09265 [Candidatus Hydrogenedentes bacterium]|nr:hypothetical protein [Candidatus Hydrogenedentota bacterium]
MYMVERTGTLWENVQDHASLNHGFASHIVVSLYRDILGVYRLDPLNKILHIRLPDIDLSWCAGGIPVGDAVVTVQWRSSDDVVNVYWDAPADYTVTVENATGLSLKKSDAPLF